MPLPTNDPVAFRAVPSLGGNKKMALTMTFTQKQVEAMFQRHDALRAEGSSQCPIEIDFEDNKIYIGEIATPFARVKEDGTREICQRSPTVSKPLAGITLAGNVIGKLNIQRDYDKDISDNIRKLTEAELSKRKEHNIVRLDSPPVLSNAKKPKPGSGTSSLAKKAMANSIMSTQAASRRTTSTTVASRPATPQTTSPSTRPTPPASSVRPMPSGSSGRSSTSGSSTTQPVTSSSTPAEPDLTSLRSHMIHYLALDPQNTQNILLKMGEYSPGYDNTREVEETLTTVAEEVRRPKNTPPGPVSWQLRHRSWFELRPHEYGSLSDADRNKLARKGRITLAGSVDQSDPIWEHIRADVDVYATSSSTKGKGKEKATGSQPLVKTSNFKGGMFPKEKKVATKGGGVSSGGITKTKATATKSKTKKVQEDEVEAKARKVIAALDDAKPKGKKAPSASAAASGSASNRSKPKEEDKEEHVIILGTKSRQLLAVDAPPPSKARRQQDERSSSKHKLADTDAEGDSDIEDGELPVKPAPKKRKIAAEAPKVKLKPSEKNGMLPNKAGKDKEKVSAKGESVASSKSLSTAPRNNAIASSSKAAGPSGNKALRLEKERERQERETLELERQKDREREKRRAGEKRSRRRATPSFSSDEDEEAEVTPAAPPRATKPKAPAQPIAKLAAPAPKSARVPSPVLPTDKEGLRLRYVACYARYIGVTSKLHEQGAKIEEALADAGSTSADDDVEMLDTEQLVQLRVEHERLRDELERIQRAHATAF